MKTLRYTIIKSEKQYNEYCNILEDLTLTDSKANEDEIELLTLLIDRWDHELNSFEDVNPVELIKSLMETNNLKSKDLMEILGLSKGTISKILNYHKGLSKETIRKLSSYFNISQEAFNRPYKLVNEIINSLVPETVDFARDELKEVISKAKFDNNILIRHIGELAEEYIQMRALDQINNDEFVELMEDLIDLEKMQFHKISVEAKARAERIVKGIRDLVLDKLFALI